MKVQKRIIDFDKWGIVWFPRLGAISSGPLIWVGDWRLAIYWNEPWMSPWSGRKVNHFGKLWWETWRVK